MVVHHPFHHASFFFIIILLFSFPNYSQSLTTHEDDERGILLGIKQEYWGNPSSLEQWNSTSSPCDWPGISCNSNGSVTRISLSEMIMGGSFPASTIICQLKNLVSINFSFNSLWGTIPANLSSCSKLEILDLSINDFTGKIAGELFSMKRLRSLNLDSNMLSGEIPTPMVAPSLESLDLSHNLLIGSIPSELFSMKRLRNLNLQYNMLSGEIPMIPMVAHSLEDLDLSSNQLNGSIPSELFSMKRLRSLNLQYNMLSGEIPKIPMVAHSLEDLDLSSNHLSGSIPDDIGNLYNLTNLDLSSNSFSGSIPEDIGNLYNLAYIDLAMNSFSGPIPHRLLHLHQLSHLLLSFNKLSSELPTPMVAYSLEHLDLSSNSLSGSIPGDIGNLYHLSNLDLSRNSFTGPIPARLMRLPQLSYLWLSFNKLSGEIPTTMVAHSLEHLDLSSNSLSGSIPGDIGNLHNLSNLDLSRNSFTGPIPARLMRLPQLSYLSLVSNNLTGEIPANVDLLSLSNIDISHNHLSGSIPRGFGELQQLLSIDVSYNKFSGDICETVSNMWVKRMIDLKLCFNNFSGRIPYEKEDRSVTSSCFDKANLCSDVRDRILPTFSTHRCSNYTIIGHKRFRSNTSKEVIITTCAVTAVLVIGLVILVLMFRRRGERREENDGEEEQTMIPFQRLEFSEGEILGGLTDENLIGNGGSGKVYRVTTTQGQRVAVKSIRHEPRQGHRLEKQFQAEIQILGRIRHCNIVKLLCCITGNNTKLLVYEYMDRQCLYRLLHGKKNGLAEVQVLHWERRLNIAIGAAQGLKYMHHDCSPPIIDRDIKSSNILLDSEFNVKIADFGLAKIPVSEANPETASAIMGTFGYIAPEYCSTQKVNVKSNIYSFGVVLLELATGREAVTPNEDINLAQWAYKHQREGNSVADALDEEIKDPHYLEAATTLFKLGLACTLSSPSSRPSMKYVLQILQRCNNAFERAIPNGAAETQINSENNHLSSRSG